jgi:hypothetical protein
MHQPVESSVVTQFPRKFVLETLWWPRDCISRGLNGSSRQTPDEWCHDLLRTGAQVGNVIEFLTEDVLERFTLVVKEDGSSRSYPDVIRMPNGAMACTNEGHCSMDVDELATQCHALHTDTPWLFPLKYSCRVGITICVNMRLAKAPDGFCLKYEGKSAS